MNPEKLYPIIQNLHTHTMRCKHAAGDVEEYVKEAKSQGIKILGISDHTPLPDDWAPNIRMGEQELPGYLKAIQRARRDYPDITLYSGLECDYFPRYEAYFKEELLGHNKLDYLIGSIHAFELEGREIYMEPSIDMGEPILMQAYAKAMVQAIHSGLFAFIAHPDLFNTVLKSWNPQVEACIREIMKAAESSKVPLEINTSGYGKARQNPELFLPPPYPFELFWKIAAEYDIRVVVNSDAHLPELLTADLGNGYKLMRKYGLREARLTFIEGRILTTGL